MIDLDHLGRASWVCDTFDQALTLAADKTDTTGVPHTIRPKGIPHVGDFWLVERDHP